MIRRCRRRKSNEFRRGAEKPYVRPAALPIDDLQSRFAGRWQVVKGAWTIEFRAALERTRGNVELAVALATTMVFTD